MCVCVCLVGVFGLTTSMDIIPCKRCISRSEYYGTLLHTHTHLLQILTTLVKGVSKPVTCKIRILPTVCVCESVREITLLLPHPCPLSSLPPPLSLSARGDSEVGVSD